jgi:hypothetical protein
MFESLDAGYFPICIATVIAGWRIAAVRSARHRGMFALFVPVGFSLLWLFLPRIPALIAPAKRVHDPWVPWAFIAATSWSFLAVPVSVVATFFFAFLRTRRHHGHVR